MKPLPLPLDGALRSERQILQHRKLGCPFYRGCLSHSVTAGWESFSCARCPIAAQVGGGPGSELSRLAQQRKGDRFG